MPHAMRFIIALCTLRNTNKNSKFEKCETVTGDDFFFQCFHEQFN